MIINKFDTFQVKVKIIYVTKCGALYCSLINIHPVHSGGGFMVHRS